MGGRRRQRGWAARAGGAPARSAKRISNAVGFWPKPRAERPRAARQAVGVELWTLSTCGATIAAILLSVALVNRVGAGTVFDFCRELRLACSPTSTRKRSRDAPRQNTTNKRYAVVPSPNVSRANCLASAFRFASAAASSSSFACCAARRCCRSSSLTRFASASNNSLGGTGRNFW